MNIVIYFIVLIAMLSSAFAMAEVNGLKPIPKLATTVNEWFRGQSFEQLKQLQSRYDVVYKEFQKQVCSPQDNLKYSELFKQYRNQGVFIPLKDGKINLVAVRFGIKSWKEKSTWLNALIKKMLKTPSIKDPAPQLEKLKKLLDENLKIQYQLSSKSDEGNSSQHLLKNAKQLVDQFKNDYAELEETIFYLSTFQYPVDHLNNRQTFEAMKLAGESASERTDELFMLRKVLEDGALDLEQKGSDTFLRTTLDTFKLALIDQGYFFDRRIRADFDYLLISLPKYASQGKYVILERLQEWLKRMQFTISFYEDLVKSEKKSQEVATNFSEATQNLQRYVTNKLADTYRFWDGKPEELKMIYVMETILFHEVGALDPLELEKSWVGQVVINRVNKPGYEHLGAKEELAIALREQKYEPDDLWLNVLFRKGEFSFTYFFLPSSLKIFCPDQSPSGKVLRRQNIRLGIHLLRHADLPDRLTNAERYFSRVSMLGRIDMSKIWTNYVAVEERPGKSIIPTMSQISCIKQGPDCFRYLYHFFWQGEPYYVVEIEGQKVVWRQDSNRNYFWTVRDLDLFQFFRPITTNKVQSAIDEEITQSYISQFKRGNYEQY